MPGRDSVVCRDRAAWRAWLEAHHSVEKEVWLVFLKKHTKKPTVSYDEAVQETICFGWIDGILKRVDEERYVQKFTPRTDDTRWSAKNIERARKMIREGLMTEAGLVKFRPTAPHAAPASSGFELAPELLAVLEAHRRAFGNFSRLTPSQRRLYVGWIMSAKKEETRSRRLREAIARLEKGQLLGMK